MKNSGFNLFKELKRRNVYRVATVYAIIGWLIIQVADATFPYLGLPDWIITGVIIFVLIGFPVALVMAWAFEMSPSGIVRTTSEKADDNPFPDHKKKPLTGIVTISVLVFLLIAQFVYFYFIRSPKPAMQEIQEAGLVFPSNSIAVLPFANMSENKDNQYFSDGVMEAILNNLSMIQDLKVVSRTSVEKYRDTDKSMPEIASELEVANILEGSVQRNGDQVRITAQLISAANDEHLWADSYDRNLTDIFSIQSEIAETIAENLEVILTTDELELIKNAPTTNLKAYEIYLKATALNLSSEELIKQGLEMSQEAIRLDPDFAYAYAQKGNFLAGLSFYGYPKTLTQDSAMLMEDMAIQKDPRAWWPHMFKAQLYFRVLKFDDAEKELLKAININPNSAEAYNLLGRYHLSQKDYKRGIGFLLKSASLGSGINMDDPGMMYEQMGYFLSNLDMEQSRLQFLKALEINPDNRGVLTTMVRVSRYFGEYDKMLEYAIRSQELSPDLLNARTQVGEAYLKLGAYDLAEKQYLECYDVVLNFENDYSVYAFLHRLGYAKLMNGKVEEGTRLLEIYRDTLLAAHSRNLATTVSFGDYYDLGLIYASLGQKEEALHWLREARAHETSGAFFRMDYLKADPMLDGIRNEPEFQQLLEEKRQEEEEIKQIFYEQLSQYHDNNQLMWLKSLDQKG